MARKGKIPKVKVTLLIIREGVDGASKVGYYKAWITVFMAVRSEVKFIRSLGLKRSFDFGSTSARWVRVVCTRVSLMTKF